MRVCERFPDLDKAVYFHCVNKARKLFNEVFVVSGVTDLKVLSSRSGHPNLISNWGLGLSLYLHGCVIDTSCEIKMKTANTLLLKAQEHMTYVVYRLKLAKENGMERYIKRAHYHLGCVNASMKIEEESLFWLTKAKVKVGLPRDVAQIFRDYQNIIENRYYKGVSS